MTDRVKINASFRLKKEERGKSVVLEKTKWRYAQQTIYFFIKKVYNLNGKIGAFLLKDEKLWIF